jgi:sorting nexin-25
MSDESQHRIKLQTLKTELEETDDMLASMPENVGSSSLAQRKKALDKDRTYLNNEIKKLEHYIDHTEEWFGTIGKWSVEVHSVDLSAENEKDPFFVIVVHRPELSRRENLRDEDERESEHGGDAGRGQWAMKDEECEDGMNTPVSYFSPTSSPLTQSPTRIGRLVGRPSTSSEGGKSDTYDIVDPSDEALSQQQQAGWVVGRRLTNFEQLHSKVVEISPTLQLPPLPKRLNPFHKPDSDSKYWQNYRMALQSYLRNMLKDSRLQESEEVFNFLSPASENLRQSSLIHPERKKNPFSLSVPLFSKDEEESTITEHMYALMSEIFELDEWSRVLRKQLMDLVQLTYGKNLHRSMQESMNWVVSEPMLSFYLEMFRDTMWPNGQPAPPSPIRSDEQKARTKDEAKKKFLKSSPQGIQTILGQRNCQIGFQKIFEALQDPRANKQLFYALFELLLYALVPELETVEIEDTNAQSLTGE